jgi:hypothetical protein
MNELRIPLSHKCHFKNRFFASQIQPIYIDHVYRHFEIEMALEGRSKDEFKKLYYCNEFEGHMKDFQMVHNNFPRKYYADHYGVNDK